MRILAISAAVLLAAVLTLATATASRSSPTDNAIVWHNDQGSGSSIESFTLSKGRPLGFYIVVSAFTLVDLTFPNGSIRLLYRIPHAQKEGYEVFVPYAPRGTYRIRIGTSGVWVGYAYQMSPSDPRKPLKKYYEGDSTYTEQVAVPATAKYVVSGTCKCRATAFLADLYDYRGHGRTLIQTNTPFRGQTRVSAKRTRVIAAGKYILLVKGDRYWQLHFSPR